MDYEKLYKEALERAKGMWEQGMMPGRIEYIFPGLKESEDERIRKEIIKFIKVSKPEWKNYSDYSSWIDWLEKQGKEEYALKSFKDEDVHKFMQYIENEAKAYEFNLPNRGYDIYAFAKDLLVWLEKQGKNNIGISEATKKKLEDNLKKELKKIDNWVDLGLPSGTLWKSTNEEGYYTYDEVVNTFSDQLPTKEQFKELKDNCTWEWKGHGYKVIGPNGNSIFLTALGYRDCNGYVSDVGSYGRYWSSTPYGSDYAWYLYFYSGKLCMYNYYRCGGLPVRLVKNK